MKHKDGYKFWVGDELSGLHHNKLAWIAETFPRESYHYVDEGYMFFDQYVVFHDEKDAVLYQLRWR